MQMQSTESNISPKYRSPCLWSCSSPQADNYLVQQVKKTNNSTYIHFFANNFNQSLDTLLKLYSTSNRADTSIDPSPFALTVSLLQKSIISLTKSKQIEILLMILKSSRIKTLMSIFFPVPSIMLQQTTSSYENS